MKKKTIIISGIAAVLVIGSVVFCFAVKGDSTQPAEVAQTVTEAVATPSIEVTQETTEEDEDAGVSTQTEEVKPVEPKQEEVKPAETKPVETQPQQTKTEPNVNQISTDEASQALINQILANGGSVGIPEGVNMGQAGNFVNTDGWTSGGVME